MQLTTFTVSFFGHRILEEPLVIERKLEELIQRLLLEKEYVEFLVGRDGEFDLLASSVIHRCQRTVRHDNCSHIWLLPYVTAKFRGQEEDFRAYYDGIEIHESGAHYKNAHQARNRAMVDRSDLVVFCVQRPTGGAWQTMAYARKRGVSWINLDSRELSGML